MTQRLSLNALPSLPTSLARPTYRREALSAGIVHVGVGNFHRAHQAVYLDELFNRGRDLDWALIGAGTRPADAAMRKVLAEQDWLTCVVELGPEGSKARITGAMTDFLAVRDDASALVTALLRPEIRIVSLTVTEGGYCVDPATGEFDPEHPETRFDSDHPDRPKGVFGAIVAALRGRRDAGHAPFTIMSCDNVPSNGEVARAAVVGLAGLTDPGLAEHIRRKVAFPSSMVDRITPATTDRERAFVEETFGFSDGWPVVCEPYRQWVLEDHFSAGRPALDEVGVTFVADVTPYELMKIRILNGGHAALAYPSALLGHRNVHEAMVESLIRAFLEKLEMQEIIPCVGPPAGLDLENYLRVVLQRFSNSAVRDTVARLASDGSNRQPKFILPSTRDRLRAGRGVAGLALVSASWCRYCAGTDEDGSPVVLEDPAAPRLREAAHRARNDPAAFLELRDIFGDLVEAPVFRNAFGTALRSLWAEGTRTTLRRYLEGSL